MMIRRGGIVGYCVDCGKSAAAIELLRCLFGKLQQPDIVETLILFLKPS